MAPPMSVEEYYADKNVLITGATGFMGKVLVEKLLRSCPRIRKIYILIRAKKGLNSSQRLEEILKCPVSLLVANMREEEQNIHVFNRLHAEQPDCFSKLHLVPGDILQEGIFNEKDREELKEECQILFHVAARVKFGTKLKDAAKINTLGTKHVLQVAEEMNRLEVFLHVSTAFCRCELSVLEERLYPSHEPQKVLDCLEWMDDELVDHLEPKLIEPEPNTYAYTKSLTETLVSQYEGKFPIAIARPSIVSAALKEPMPGWVDNLNGPTSLLLGAAKGALRTIHCQGEFKVDLVPVDLVVNGCILLAYNTGANKIMQLQVVNLTESGRNPVTWSSVVEMGLRHAQEYPFSVCLWSPGVWPMTSKLLHQIAVLVFHILPAYVVDVAMIAVGRKTFMVRIQKKISRGLKVFQYYLNREWDFRNDNLLALRETISEKDDETFYTDIKMVDWNSYFRNYIRGIREYYIKEDPATIPQAHRLRRQLYWLDITTKIVIFVLIPYFVFFYLDTILSIVFKNNECRKIK